MTVIASQTAKVDFQEWNVIFMFLSSGVLIDSESQSMAAALSVKAASDLLVRCPCPCWRRGGDHMSKCCFVLIKKSR